MMLLAAPPRPVRLQAARSSTAGRCSCAARSRELTVMFTDIEASTAMNERLGDVAMHRVLKGHHEAVRAEVGRYGGAISEPYGDGFMALFSSADDALRCATDIQRSIARLGRRLEIDLRVRVGLHTGPVIECGDTPFGRTLVIAARIASRARGGQILVSSALRDAAGGSFSFSQVRRRSLKGLRGRYQVAELKTSATNAGRHRQVLVGSWSRRAPTPGYAFYWRRFG